MTTQETAPAQFDFSELTCKDYLDVRDIIARVEALESTRDDWAEWQQGENEMEEAPDPFGADEQAELTALNDILDDMKGYGGDEQWRGDWYPVTLIRDSCFTEYAEELITDCGYIPKDFPDWIAIDWEATASAVQQDYTSTEIDGVTYWYR